MNKYLDDTLKTTTITTTKTAKIKVILKILKVNMSYCKLFPINIALRTILLNLRQDINYTKL